MGKIDEALSILKALGLPKAQQNERSALTLLALADLKKKTPWSKAKSRLIRIHDILVFIQKNYGNNMLKIRERLLEGRHCTNLSRLPSR